MGDRCYMQITCRRRDQVCFEKLGFHIESESPGCPVIVMADDEANYAHCNDLPSDIPYHGFNASGGDYGEGKVACDGTRFASVAGTSDGFVVRWDNESKQPTPQSLEEIRHFIEVRDAVEKILAGISDTKNTATTAITKSSA